MEEKSGDKFLRELARAQHELDKKNRMMLWLIDNSKPHEFCPICQCDLTVWREMHLGEHLHFERGEE